MPKIPTTTSTTPEPPPAADAAGAPDKPLTKAELVREVATRSGHPAKDVKAVLEALEAAVAAELEPDGVGQVTIPGLVKVKVHAKEATPEKQAKNPFKPGEMMTIKAKPARRVLKVTPAPALKKLVSPPA